MALVGIDLGTTNSLISVFTDDGPQLIKNGAGSYLTPSVVGLSDKGDIIVGEAAKYRLGDIVKTVLNIFLIFDVTRADPI